MKIRFGSLSCSQPVPNWSVIAHCQFCCIHLPTVSNRVLFRWSTLPPLTTNWLLSVRALGPMTDSSVSLLLVFPRWTNADGRRSSAINYFSRNPDKSPLFFHLGPNAAAKQFYSLSFASANFDCEPEVSVEKHADHTLQHYDAVISPNFSKHKNIDNDRRTFYMGICDHC